MGTALWRPAAALGFLVAGFLARLAPDFVLSDQQVWLIGLIGLGLPLAIRTVREVLKGKVAIDLIATLAIIAAVWLNQPLAGLLIVLMQTGGEALEQAAARRATSAVAELEADAPRVGHRLRGGQVEDVTVDQIVIGDRLLIRPGEMVPCNGILREGRSSFDTSRFTGEPLPRSLTMGDSIVSGAINLDRPVVVEATATAAGSLYHQIIELVRTAQASKAPFQRLADRTAGWFTPFTLLVSAGAYFLSGDPTRVLAVLVVATPCPLLLAVPTAMLGGIGRAARHRIIIRHGTAVENLASADVAIFDKTGTLTLGMPAVSSFEARPPYASSEVLTWAGAVEQGSGHPLARSVVRAAVSAGEPLPEAFDVEDQAGRGVTGQVAGHQVTVGAASLIAERHPRAMSGFEGRNGRPDELAAFVVVDDNPGGVITFADRIRPTASALIAGLEMLGIRRSILLSGDRAANARSAAAALGMSEGIGDLLPVDKVNKVAELERSGHRVVMVGDGANDAPALSAASVGIAVAAQGGGISAEAADIILLSDDLTTIPEGVAIARRTVSVARQSVAIGLGLSIGAMGFAAAGYLAPTLGAALQEGIDVLAILNALRTLRPGRTERRLHQAWNARAREPNSATAPAPTAA